MFIRGGWFIRWLGSPDVWRVDIRRHPRDIQAAAEQKRPIGKYHKLAGSSDGLYNFPAIKADYPLIIVESPLDALIGQQEVPRDFRWVATGGDGGGRSAPWRGSSAQAGPGPWWVC